MLRKTMALLIAATLGIALTADRAEAWGGFRAGGFRAGGYGGYGGFSHFSAGGVGGMYGGAYHAGVTGYRPSTGFYHYGTTGAQGMYGGAHYSSGFSTYHPSYYGGAYGGGIRYGSGTGHVQSGVPFTTVY
jgi:hypothetical protein